MAWDEIIEEAKEQVARKSIPILAQTMSAEAIAELLEIPLDFVREVLSSMNKGSGLSSMKLQ